MAGEPDAADQSAFEWLRDRTFNWKNAVIGGIIGALIPYGGAVIDGSPNLSKHLQQLIPFSDGTLAMPWFKKSGKEAAEEGYKKASGNESGGGSKSNQATDDVSDVISKPQSEDEIVNDLIGKDISETSLYQSLRERYDEKTARRIALNLERGNSFNDMILEVPVQKKPVPRNVREYATDNDVCHRIIQPPPKAKGVLLLSPPLRQEGPSLWAWRYTIPH